MLGVINKLKLRNIAYFGITGIPFSWFRAIVYYIYWVKLKFIQIKSFVVCILLYFKGTHKKSIICIIYTLNQINLE